jgi:hypothetical protein
MTPGSRILILQMCASLAISASTGASCDSCQRLLRSSVRMSYSPSASATHMIGLTKGVVIRASFSFDCPLSRPWQTPD